MTYARLALVLAAPLLLVSCLLTPGKFTSTLDVKRDRSFTFTYVGEAIVAEEQGGLQQAECAEDDEDCTPPTAADKAEKAAAQEAKLKEVGEALSKEAGYRSVEYLGNRKFRVDYAVSGTLDRSFIYPFNSDAAAIIPWIAIELRKDGTARIKAPGFGDEGGGTGAAPNPLAETAREREGTFTLTTDAEIVAQNEESGAAAGPGGTKRIVWRVTPSSKLTPTAVLRF
jgi:hypothetical protein